jgi:hypothetical protein
VTVFFAMLIAIFDAVVAIAVVLIAILAAYLGYRVIHGIRVYFWFQGTPLLICPETHEAEVGEMAPKSIAI